MGSIDKQTFVSADLMLIVERQIHSEVMFTKLHFCNEFSSEDVTSESDKFLAGVVKVKSPHSLYDSTPE